MTLRQRDFWERYLATVDDRSSAQARYFGTFKIGSSLESADEGARLILTGQKTTTSEAAARLAALGEDAPDVGALSLLLDGRDAPVAVVETVEVTVTPFDAVDATFAWEYGEWDRTLATWRRELGAYYARLALAEGWTWEEGNLLCERFRVVFGG